MSTIKVNTIENRNGSNINIGKSGTTVGFVAGTTVDFSTNSPTISGLTASDVSGVATVNGITEADQWRLTANKTSNGDLNANLERNDAGSFGYIGTGMSESSGIFTFPSTGIWLVEFNVMTNDRISGDIMVTIDNSSYSTVARIEADSSLQSCFTSFMFDVTSTSTHKCKFNRSGGTGTIYGNTFTNYTSFTFIRLGDT